MRMYQVCLNTKYPKTLERQLNSGHAHGVSCERSKLCFNLADLRPPWTAHSSQTKFRYLHPCLMMVGHFSTRVFIWSSSKN